MKLIISWLGTFVVLVISAAMLADCSGSSSGGGSSIISTSTSAPAAPAGVQAVAGDGQVNLIWTAPSGTVSSYAVYYSDTDTVSTSSTTRVIGITSTSTTIIGLTDGMTYYFIVTAVNAGGESPASSQVSATLPSHETAPAGVQAVAGDGQVNLIWTAPSGTVSSYTVYYSLTDPVTTASPSLVTGITGTSTTIPGLTNGTTYYFIVTAVNAGGESPASSQVSSTPGVMTLASGHNPVGIAVDSTSVYWTDSGLETVNKIGINGGTVTTLATGSNPQGIAVDSTSVYWTETGSVNKVGLNGGTVMTLATGNGPQRIAVDSTSVYWTETGSVNKVGLNGGTVMTLATGSYPQGIAVDSTSVYWTDTGLGTVNKVGINGGTVTTLVTATDPQGIAVDSISVYWSETGSIDKVGIVGGTVTTLASGQFLFEPIAVDSASVYWAESSSINRVGINGGIVTTVATGKNPQSIAVDSTSVYWTEAETHVACPQYCTINGCAPCYPIYGDVKKAIK